MSPQEAHAAAEVVFSAACVEVRAARAAFMRSRSKKNFAAFQAAEAAFESALAASIAAREAYQEAARREEIAERLAARAARRGPANHELF